MVTFPPPPPYSYSPDDAADALPPRTPNAARIASADASKATAKTALADHS